MDSLLNKNGTIFRIITLKEWGWILDFPESKTQQMKEGHLDLLKNSEMRGKIFYSALYFLSDQDHGEETTWPVCDNLGTNLGGGDVITVGEVGNKGEDKALMEEVVLGSQKEREPADKVAKANNSAVPKYLLDSYIIANSMEHWESKNNKDK